jgi:hypothetical protein
MGTGLGRIGGERIEGKEGEGGEEKEREHT